MSMEYDADTLEHIKKVELMILKDFADICKENNIDYYLLFGSLIGAVRHQGFIPWDDDIDIGMYRKDYEKLLKIMESGKYSNKYYMLDSRYYDDYFFLFGRFSLKNTKMEEVWRNQVSYDLGFHLDVFILDKVPENKIKQFFHRKHCFLLDKLLSMSTIRLEDDYSTPVRIISNTGHKILNALNLTPQYFQKKALNAFTKYENTETDCVSDLTVKGQLVFKNQYFSKPKKAKFEDFEANIPADADKVLTIQFGDYMTLPPEEERVSHNLYDIDFGEY